MSGSFWKLSSGFTSLSNVSTILESYEMPAEDEPSSLIAETLIKLLDEGDLLQELMSNNSLLLEFLRDHRVLTFLVDLLIQESLTGLQLEESLKRLSLEATELEKEKEKEEEIIESVIVAEVSKVNGTDSDASASGTDDDSAPDVADDAPVAETLQERSSRYAALAAEIFSADVWSLTDTVMDSTHNLNKLWSILDINPPLSINLATYFMKIMEHLLDMKCEEMVTYLIENQPCLVEKFIKHLANPPLMDFLLKLISTDKPDNSTGIVDFLQEQNLIRHLINALDSSKSDLPEKKDDKKAEEVNVNDRTVDENDENDKNGSKEESTKMIEDEEEEEELKPDKKDHSEKWEDSEREAEIVARQLSAADFLKALITISANSTTDNSTIGPNELTRELVSLESMSRLCDIMLQGGFPLGNGVGVIIEIIRKNNSDYDILPVLYITLESHSPTGRDPIYLGHLLSVFGGKISEFNKLLMRRNIDRTLKTTFGEIEPLGFERFKICELIAELLHCSNMALLNDNKGYDVVKLRDDLRANMKAIDRVSFKYNENVEMPPSDLELFLSQEKEIKKKFLGQTKRKPPANDSFDDTFDLFNSKLRTSDDDEDEEVHANANLSEEQIRANPVIGDFLKIALYDTQIITNILSMFFQFPWNNFLHNVVFDIVQQVLNGSMDIGFNKFLAINTFSTGDITHKIIEGQRLCTEYEEAHGGLRLGYMGHLTLIAEEVVKFIQLYPVSTVSLLIDEKIEGETWQEYVNRVLCDTRKKYNAILGGSDVDDDDVSNTLDESNGEIIDDADLQQPLHLDPLVHHDLMESEHAEHDEEEFREDVEDSRDENCKNLVANFARKDDVNFGSSDESESDDDDDHFANYMSLQLTNPAAGFVATHGKGKAYEGMYEGMYEGVEYRHLDGDNGYIDPNDDGYIDPNDDGMSYRKPNSFYDSLGLLVNDPHRRYDNALSDDSTSSSDGEDNEQNKLTRAASKGL